MSFLFAICDSQQNYVYKLTEYLNQKRAVPFQIVAFSSVEKFLEYEKNTEVELLLITEELFMSEKDSFQTSHIILLNETGIERVKNYPFIYKYQSAEQIAKQILQIYGEVGDASRLAMVNRKIEIIGIYSPIKRCLQTSFALTLGQLIGKEKKCLYLNFEAFSGFSRLLKQEYEQDFMDLMYFLNGGIEKFVYKLKGMVESIGDLDYIPPALSFMDFAQIDGKSIRLLLEEIATRTDYEVLILDLSDYLNDLFDILLVCDRIYTITKEDGIALAKLQQYEQLVSCMQKEEILGRTRKVSLPTFEEIPSRLEELPFSQLAEYIREEILK